jgi:hypothetical protein
MSILDEEPVDVRTNNVEVAIILGDQYSTILDAQ